MGIESTTRSFSLSPFLFLSRSFALFLSVRVYASLLLFLALSLSSFSSREQEGGKERRDGTGKRERKSQGGRRGSFSRRRRGLGTASCIGEHKRSRNNTIGRRARAGEPASCLTRVRTFRAPARSPRVLGSSSLATRRREAETRERKHGPRRRCSGICACTRAECAPPPRRYIARTRVLFL